MKLKFISIILFSFLVFPLFVIILLVNTQVAFRNDSEGGWGLTGGLVFKKNEAITMLSEDLFLSPELVRVAYTYENTTTVNGENDTTTNQGVYELGFSGNKVSLFENYFNPSVLQSIEDSSITSTGVDYEGADYLYLKGGEGSMAIIELFADDEFGNTYEDYLNEFRVQNNGQTTVKRLINEAFLEFYIEETLYSSDLPNRVYLYDLENNIPVAEYFLHQTVNTASADSKYNHLVPLATETDSEGNTHKKYKVRLTEHLNNIIARDSTNVKLGLVVSSNVGAANTKKLHLVVSKDLKLRYCLGHNNLMKWCG